MVNVEGCWIFNERLSDCSILKQPSHTVMLNASLDTQRIQSHAHSQNRRKNIGWFLKKTTATKPLELLIINKAGSSN